LRGDGARYHLVLTGDIARRLAGLVERTVGISQTGSVACVERIAEPVTARVHRGKHDIRIRIPKVGIDAPAAADDVLPVAANGEHSADARPDVVSIIIGSDGEG